ncbi:MAG: copper amine oxidase N-terminal domain-containing protein [Butyricicoccus sp.]
MKKTLLKRFAVLTACCALATTVAFAASTIHKTVTIEYANIKLVVDGVTITPKDANGSTVEPFIYNGTTYLPVRAVGNAIGKQVTWDGNTKTVYLGDAPNSKKWLMDLCPPYETDYGYYEANGNTTDGTNSFKMAGQSYSRGFMVAFCAEDVGTNVLFNLNGQYSTLDFDLGPVDGHSGLPLLLKFYLDGELTETIEMTSEDLPRHCSVNLNKALQMKVVAVSAEGNGWWGTQYGIANAALS